MKATCSRYNKSMHYHRYAPVSENTDGLVEVCAECKHRLVTKKDPQGRVDQRAYLREHVADTAQPTGATSKVFGQLYGKPKV